MTLGEIFNLEITQQVFKDLLTKQFTYCIAVGFAITAILTIFAYGINKAVKLLKL